MLWILAAFLAVLMFSIGNIIDSFLSNKTFSKTTSLIFYINILNLVFLPLLFIFEIPKIPIGMDWIYLILAGAFITLSSYPYFKALQHDDTSTTISLYSLEYLFTPILAFLLLNEALRYYHYIGIATLAFSAFMIAYKGKLKLNKAIYYMLASVIAIMIANILMKNIVGNLGWVTVMFWTSLVGGGVGAVMFIFDRQAIAADYKKVFLPNIKTLIIMEFIAFVAFSSMIYAYSLAPLTLVVGLFATKPFVIILLAIVGHKIWPNKFKEDISSKVIIKKSIFFVLMIIGVVLLVR